MNTKLKKIEKKIAIIRKILVWFVIFTYPDDKIEHLFASLRFYFLKHASSLVYLQSITQVMIISRTRSCLPRFYAFFGLYPPPSRVSRQRAFSVKDYYRHFTRHTSQYVFGKPKKSNDNTESVLLTYLKFRKPTYKKVLRTCIHMYTIYRAKHFLFLNLFSPSTGCLRFPLQLKLQRAIQFSIFHRKSLTLFSQNQLLQAG